MGKGELADSVANICFIPASLNKDISGKKPSDYIATLSNANQELDAALSSHFITNDSRKYLDSNEFEPFLKSRAHAIKLTLDSLMNNS